MTIKAPYLSYEKIGEIAKDFLMKFHPSLTLPIPIERIIEFNLGLDIVPAQNLYKVFSQSGFLSADRTKIFIDEFQYDNLIEKYRFTLAHEVGHYIMHKSLYKGLSFGSIQEYFEYFESIPQKELYWFETQGDFFAGQLLVPTEQLEKHCIDLLKSNNNQFSDYSLATPDFWSYASNVLAGPFEVNPIVIEIRIRKEKLENKFIDFYQK